FVLIFFVPERPRWLLLHRGKIEEATAIMQKISGEQADSDIELILKNEQERQGKGERRTFSNANRVPVILAILFAVFNQVSGINAIIYYAPRVFEMAGLGAQSSLLSTVGIGLVNFIFTLIAINFIDKVGRRKLMFIGSIGLIVSLSLVSY